MSIIGYVILALFVVIAILEMSKIIYAIKKKYKNAWDIGSCMTIGSREVQEDQMETLVTDNGLMAVIADGAGKTYGGRIAAKIAVDTCVEIFKDYNAFNNPQYYFQKAFRCANKEILKVVESENCGNASVGCVMIRAGYLYYALVGNVKICVYREGELIPVSVGHTVAVLAQHRFKEGKISRQQAIELLENHRLYNYLGKEDFKNIEFFDAPVALKPTDVVVIMSDGIYELLGFKEIEEVLKKKGNCNQKAFEIVEKVNMNQSEDKDNASIILIYVGNEAMR